MTKIVRSIIKVETKINDEVYALIESGEVTEESAAERLRHVVYSEIADSEQDTVTVSVEFIKEGE